MLIDRVTTLSGQAFPPSLYAAEVAAPRPRPALEGSATTEVAIVGAGFCGLSTALHLAGQGVPVTVLEAGQPGFGASGRNGGQINPGLKHGPAKVVRDHGLATLRFAQGAPDRVFDLVARLGIACDIHRGGTLRAATDSASAAALAGLQAEAVAHDIPMQWLDAADMAALTGSRHYRAGLLDPAGGQLDPLAFVRGLATAVEAAGGRICGHSAVTDLRALPGGGWRLKTRAGQLDARRVLVATNGYTDPLIPGLARSVLPVYSAIIASEPLPEPLLARMLIGRPSVFEVGPVTTYYRIDRHNRLVFGGRGAMRDLSGPDALPGLVRHACRLWPELQDIRWTHGWNGRVAITADHYPHLHRLGPDGYACLGWNGRGVAMATAMGAELARILTGGPGDPILPISPITPITLQPLWKLGVAPALALAKLRARFAR